MNIKKLFSVPDLSISGDMALLLLRVVAGIAFMLHGWSKIQNPFGWMGPDGFAPGIFQALAALSEFGGGLAWILGLLVPLASLGIASTMLVAVYTHAIMRGDPFVGQGASYELALVYLCVAVVFLSLGPGRIALDRLMFGRRVPCPPKGDPVPLA